MAVKSVLDINVNDEAFKSFADRFERYRKALDDMPGAWKKVNDSTKQQGNLFSSVVASLLAERDAREEIAEQADKSGKSLQHHSSLWNTIQRSSTGVLHNVRDIAGFLVRMGVGLGLGAVGAGIGGLFGLLALSRSVSSQRNEALGLNMSIGQVKAFKTFQGRTLSNPDQILAQAAQGGFAGSAVARLGAILGFNPHGSTFDVANRELMAVHKFFHGMSQADITKYFTSIPAFQQVGFTLQGVTGIAHLQPGELTKDIQSSIRAAPGLGVNAAQSEQYADFLSKIDTVFGEIKTQIEKNLILLLGPIENLMHTLGDAAVKFLKSGAAKRAINDFADEIKKFASYLGSPQFSAEIKSFEQTINNMLDYAQKVGFGVHAVAHTIAHPINATGNALDYYQNLIVGATAQEMSVIRAMDILSQDPTSHVARTRIAVPAVHVHLGTFPLIKIQIQKIPGGDAVQVIQNLHGGGGY